MITLISYRNFVGVVSQLLRTVAIKYVYRCFDRSISQVILENESQETVASSLWFYQQRGKMLEELLLNKCGK